MGLPYSVTPTQGTESHNIPTSGNSTTALEQQNEDTGYNVMSLLCR
jgi:hypothetical protein